MNNLFHGILVVSPIAAIVIFLSVFFREDTKAEQRVRETTQAVKVQQFDNQFSDAWYGKPSSAVQAARKIELDDLKRQKKQAEERRDDLDKVTTDTANDLKDSIKQLDEQAKEGVSK